MKLIPASSARWMIATLSSWSGLPQAPNIIAPRHSGLTLTPVLPSSAIVHHPHRIAGAQPTIPRGPASARGRDQLVEDGAVSAPTSDRWPSSGSSRAFAPGDLSREPPPCANGHHAVLASLPHRHRPSIARSEAPIGSNARSSSSHPAAPAAQPDGALHHVLRHFAVIAASPRARPVPERLAQLIRDDPDDLCSRALGTRTSSTFPAAAAANSSMFSSPIPSSQSRPSARYGATAASVAAASTRSPSTAAHANACGPPPDHPTV